VTHSTITWTTRGARRTSTLPALLSPEARDAVKTEANAWIKRMRHVDYDGRTMRERFIYRADSLWWFTEIYLHKTRVFERAIETLLALDAAHSADGTSRLTLTAADPVARQAARAFQASRGIPVDIDGVERGDDDRDRLLGFAVGPSALLSRLRRTSRRNVTRAKVAAFVHTAFWRDEASHSSGGRESYVGPVLDAIASRVGPDRLASIGLGPRRNFRSRRWWDPFVGTPKGNTVTPIEQLAPRSSLREALELWRQRGHLATAIVSGPSIREAARWNGYDLWPAVSTVLARAADVQWPWSARSMDESRAALEHIRPEVVVTYAEAGGWGRALILEARRLGIPSVGLQHGFIYRHWLNYQHEADEMSAVGDDAGFPRPDATLVFDGFAANTLVSRGRFPDASIVVTGSPRLDEIAKQAAASDESRRILRRTLGLGETARVLVLVAKHAEVAPELPGLAEAVNALEDVRCVIKPHPAESPGLYRPTLDRSRRLTLAPPGVDVGTLLSIADGIVTMNSTAAIDAMTLGVPAIVVGLPNNLSPFVEAKVMAGASAGALRAAIEGVLYDRTVRQGLLDRGQRFVELYDMKARGHSAERAAQAVLGLAHGSDEGRQIT
jgi:hypothetical protein